MKATRVIFIGLGAIAIAWLLAFLFSNPETIAPFANAALMMGLPLVLGAVLARKLKIGWRLFGIGALTFIAAQVLHIPFNEYALKPLLGDTMQNALPGTPALALVGVVFGLSAGVFEETARWLFYRFWVKNARTWKAGMMFGAGHGGVEAILFGALAMWVFLQMVVFKDMDPAQVESLLDAETAKTVAEALVVYWNLPWYTAMLGALERVSALTLHLSMSLMVMESLRRRNWLWFAAAVLWHTIIDALAVYGITTWGAYIVEAVIFVLALISAGIVYYFYRIEPEEPEEPDQPPAPDPDSWQVKPTKITAEKLDESRYD